MSSPPQRPSATAEQPLGADLELMLGHVGARHRAAFEALWRLDAAMADVVARSTEPALGAIKLAWWREALERLDSAPPPAEPRLRAVAEHLLSAGASGAELSRLEAGWAVLLEEQIAAESVAERGRRLFAIGGRILGECDGMLEEAGALYALVSVGRRGVPELLEAAREVERRLARHRFPSRLRALTGLARLAVRDFESGPPFEPEGSPARALTMLRHRWSGRI